MTEPRYVYVVVETDPNGEDHTILACLGETVADEIASRCGGHVERLVLIGDDYE